MKEAVFQRKDKTLVPFSEEDLEAIKAFHENQPIKVKMIGVEAPRSYLQLSMYKKLCRVVAGNLDGQSMEDVDFFVKVELKHLKGFRVMPNGATFIEVDSVGYASLKHLEACKFFDRAWPVMAKMIGVTVDELLKNANKD